MSDQERPKYTGIYTYRDPLGRFLFRYPREWHKFDLADDRDGVLYSPFAQDPETWFSAWATRLPDAVTAADIDVLREGVNEGLSQFDELHVEYESEGLVGNICRFKRIYTFRDGAVVRKRQVWMIYVYEWLFVLMAQGASVSEYEHWRMMLQDCLDSFDLADALLFASDGELMNQQKESAS